MPPPHFHFAHKIIDDMDVSPKELAALSRRAQTITTEMLRDGASMSALLDTLQRLASLAGVSRDSACGRCTANAPLVPIVSEVFGIFEAVRTIPAAERDRLTSETTRCPFHAKDRCLLGDRRPLLCRPNTQEEGARIEAVEHGHQVALVIMGLAHYRVHLLPILPELIAEANKPEPSWLQRFAAGSQVYRSFAGIPVRRDDAIEDAKRQLGKREPSGFSPKDPLLERAVPDLSRLSLDSILAKLPQKTDSQRLFRLRVPFAYASEDEIDTWRARFLEELDAFIGSGFDPVNLIDALPDHDTFAIAYQGRNARDLMEPFGSKLVAPASKAALPDLSVPIAKRREGKIRVGYIGRNLRNHNGGVWALGWILNHKDDFETVALPLHTTLDNATGELRRKCTECYFLPGDLAYSARFIKSLNLDVLIYTDIGMDGLNTAYASLRLAPVQCTAWGHPVTSGLPTIDYYLSSELMEPKDGDLHYTEKLVRLPGSGLFYIPRSVPPPSRTKAYFGLDDDLLLLMPNNPLKMAPKWDSLFAEITAVTGRPIVFLQGYQPVAAEVIQTRMERAEVRAKWLPRMSPDEYLELLALADLVLDPPAWSGGNTTLDALRYQKPVVTFPGEFMRGRHGLAFLTQCRMTNMIAASPEDYVRIASDPKIWEAAVEGADWDGPFRDRNVIESLDQWIRGVARD